jgi:hypothetical protein
LGQGEDKKMKKTIIGLMIAALLISGCATKEFLTQGMDSECPECVCEEQEEKALVRLRFDGWGGAIDDVNEKLFDYTLFNHGNTEAKNVIVKCYIDDSDDKRIIDRTFNIGNLASKSYVYKQSSIVVEGSPGDLLGFCYTHSCDNCELINKGLPDYDVTRK